MPCSVAHIKRSFVCAAKTFTASKDDVVSALSFYFGQCVSALASNSQRQCTTSQLRCCAQCLSCDSRPPMSIRTGQFRPRSSRTTMSTWPRRTTSRTLSPARTRAPAAQRASAKTRASSKVADGPRLASAGPFATRSTTSSRSRRRRGTPRWEPQLRPFARAGRRLLRKQRSPRSFSPAQIGLPFRRIEGTVRGPSSAPLAPPTAGLRSVD
jgi:hypothetical protein